MKQKKKSSPFWLKLKKIEIQKRYIVLVVLLALIFRFWGESSITILQEKVPVVTATEISEKEINHYIQTKQQYLSDHIVVAQELIDSQNLEDILDKDTHEWFLVRDWRPKRFFYVDKRIKLIVSCILKQEEQLKEADNLENEARHLIETTGFITDSSLNKSTLAAEKDKKAQDIRYYIKREIRKNGISITEENNVNNYLDLLIPLVEL